MRDYFPLDSVTVITITGKDRLKWLNNLVTNDLKRTSDNRAVECFVTDVKGRTLGHGIVFSDRESLVFFSWGKDQAAKLIAHWDRYIIREDVTLADASSKWRWAFVRRALLKTELKTDRVEQLTNMEVTAIEIPLAVEDGTSKVAIRSANVAGSSGNPRFFRGAKGDNGNRERYNSSSAIAIACPIIGDEWLLVRFDEQDSIGQSLCERSNEIREEDAIDLEAIRIRQRWPLVGIDFDEKNLPQELDRNTTAISFNKGCYLGQETVARLDALGQVQKKLVRLSIDIGDLTNPNVFERGSIVKKGEQDAGAITSLTTSKDGPGRAVALAYIRRAFFTAGTELNCNGFRAIVQ